MVCVSHIRRLCHFSFVIRNKCVQPYQFKGFMSLCMRRFFRFYSLHLMRHDIHTHTHTHTHKQRVYIILINSICKLMNKNSWNFLLSENVLMFWSIFGAFSFRLSSAVIVMAPACNAIKSSATQVRVCVELSRAKILMNLSWMRLRRRAKYIDRERVATAIYIYGCTQLVVFGLS